MASQEEFQPILVEKSSRDGRKDRGSYWRSMMTPLILISTFTFGFVCGNFFPFPLLLEEDEKEQYLTKENSYGKKK